MATDNVYAWQEQTETGWGTITTIVPGLGNPLRLARFELAETITYEEIPNG